MKHLWQCTPGTVGEMAKKRGFLSFFIPFQASQSYFKGVESSLCIKAHFVKNGYIADEWNPTYHWFSYRLPDACTDINCMGRVRVRVLSYSSSLCFVFSVPNKGRNIILPFFQPSGYNMLIHFV